MTSAAPMVAVEALTRAVDQLEAAAACEDWDEVAEQLHRQYRFLEQWLPRCDSLSSEVRAALHEVLRRYHAVMFALEAARERVRQLLDRSPVLSVRERAYMEA